MIRTRTWVLGIAAVLLLSAAAAIALRSRPASGTVANLYLDGECIRSVDLSKVEEAEIFTVTCDEGVNSILIEPGRICVLTADCPDQVCVASGWLSDSAAPIICLPHRLVIRLEAAADGSGAQIDGVSK